MCRAKLHFTFVVGYMRRDTDTSVEIHRCRYTNTQIHRWSCFKCTRCGQSAVATGLTGLLPQALTASVSNFYYLPVSKLPPSLSLSFSLSHSSLLLLCLPLTTLCRTQLTELSSFTVPPADPRALLSLSSSPSFFFFFFLSLSPCSPLLLPFRCYDISHYFCSFCFRLTHFNGVCSRSTSICCDLPRSAPAAASAMDTCAFLISQR